MKASPAVDNKNLSTIASTFLQMGKTMKMDMITVVQHIKHHYPEDFQMAMFADFELNKKDNYLLLNWVHNLYPQDIKNNSDLIKELDEASLGNLLPLEQVKQLEQTYLTDEAKKMQKPRPFFNSSPPIPAKQTENKKTAKALTSSESEPDSLSIESSSEEAHPKNHMRIENHKQTPPLECFPQSPLELTGTDHDKDKQKTGLIQNFFGLFDREPTFYEASQYLIIMQKESNNDLDSSNDEETLGNLAEIEVLLKVLHQKHSIKEPELLNNAVKAVIMWVEEEEKERSIHSHFKTWKEEWRDAIQKSVEERMKASPAVDNKNLSTIASTFLQMGKTMKMDMITVVQHIKHHYPEDFQVCNTYAKFYHHYFSSQMAMFADFGLNKKTITYFSTGCTIYIHKLDEASLGNLLPLEQVKQLEQTYLTDEVDFIRSCLEKCLKIEVKSWTQEAEPRILDNYYHSELSIDAIKAISEVQASLRTSAFRSGPPNVSFAFDRTLDFSAKLQQKTGKFIRDN
ncbi:hypothetical protein E2320_021738, partial [Naja naja]